MLIPVSVGQQHIEGLDHPAQIGTAALRNTDAARVIVIAHHRLHVRDQPFQRTRHQNPGERQHQRKQGQKDHGEDFQRIPDRRLQRGTKALRLKR
jgi:hypothetical protein